MYLSVYSYWYDNYLKYLIFYLLSFSSEHIKGFVSIWRIYV